MKYYLVYFLLQSTLSSAQDDRGDLVYSFRDSKFPISHTVSNSILLEEYRLFVNKTLALPRNIPVIFCDCGEANAWYKSESHTIVMCYDYIQNALDGMKQAKYTEPDVNIVEGVSLSVLGHELGHALIHQLNLVYTSKHENAADEFSVIFMLKEAGKFYRPAFIGALNWYFEESRRSNKDMWEAYADTHAPHGERYYNYLSLLCGQDTEFSRRNGFIGDEKKYQLRSSRAKESINEYNHAKWAWDILLKYHYKAASSPKITASVKSKAAGIIQQKISSNVIVDISPGYWHLRGFNPPLFTVTQQNSITWEVSINSNGDIVRLKEQGAVAPEIEIKKVSQALFKADFHFIESPGSSGPHPGSSTFIMTVKFSP